MHLYGGVKLHQSGKEATGIFTLDTRYVEVYKAPHYENLSVYINGKLVSDTIDDSSIMNGITKELPAFGTINYLYNPIPLNYCFNGGEGAVSFAPELSNSPSFSEETKSKLPFVGFLSGANYSGDSDDDNDDCDGDLFFATSKFVNFRILD